jgi:RNA polymerase sigma factor (TIGR02999 family)
MATNLAESVTFWLQQWRDGDESALERITALIYRDLRRLAAHYLAGEQAGHTLQPTALVHEAYLQVASIRDVDWKTRSHFIALMAQIMRRILIDHARRRKSVKRTPSPAVASEPAGGFTPATLDVLSVDEALTRMTARYPRPAQVVELRFFGGLESEEIARVLEVSLTTVERDWRFARAWLQDQMGAVRE